MISKPEDRAAARIAGSEKTVVLIGFQKLGNLGLGYLSAVLRGAGFKVRVLDIEAPAELEILELLAWEGLTPAEAADVLGCSRIAVTLRLPRARRRVDRLLGELPDASPRETRPREASRVAIIKEADDAR